MQTYKFAKSIKAVHLGDPGSQGPPGSTGQPGTQGMLGSPGEKGLKGKDGSLGYDGQPGERGISGQSGNQGERGICPQYCAIDGGIFFEDGARRWAFQKIKYCNCYLHSISYLTCSFSSLSTSLIQKSEWTTYEICKDVLSKSTDVALSPSCSLQKSGGLVKREKPDGFAYSELLKDVFILLTVIAHDNGTVTAEDTCTSGCMRQEMVMWLVLYKKR